MKYEQSPSYAKEKALYVPILSILEDLAREQRNYVLLPHESKGAKMIGDLPTIFSYDFPIVPLLDLQVTQLMEFSGYYIKHKKMPWKILYAKIYPASESSRQILSVNYDTAYFEKEDLEKKLKEENRALELHPKIFIHLPR